MGSVCRFSLCKKCGKRYRRRPESCRRCGSTSFRLSDWYIRFYVLGRQQEERVGSLTLARRVLAMRETEVAEGRYKFGRKDQRVFEDFVQGMYLPTYAETGLAEKTRKDYELFLENRIIPEFGHMPLDKISRRDIEGWLARVRAEGLAPATYNKLLSIIQSVFTQAVKWQVLETNPASGVERLPLDNARLRYLSREEFGKLLEGAGNNEQLKAAMTLAVLTGLRQSALFGLRWDHIDLDARTITIPASLSKRKRAITIPIIPDVLEVLRGLPRSLRSDYVLTKPRTGTKYGSMRKAFENACRRAGVLDFTWHGFRHTFASWHVRAGTDLYTLQELMGLSSLKMVQRYAHLAPDFVAREAGNIARIFKEQGNKQGTEESGSS